MIDIFLPSDRLLLKRVIMSGILVVAVMALFHRCDRKKLEEITHESLKPGEKEAVIISPNSGSIVAIATRAKNGNGIRPSVLRGWNVKPEENPGTVVERIDGARGIRVSISDKGNVSITARTRGFCFEPGFGAYTTASDRRLFADVQLLFSRRYGVNAGIGLGLGSRRSTGSAFVAGSYNFYSNTSVLLGYDTSSSILAGLRVKF